MNDHSRELLSAFRIEAIDLAANRAGNLATRQAAMLRRSGLNNLIAALVVGVILAAILAFVANKPLKPAQWIMAAILFLATLAVGINDLRRTRRAAAAGRVERLSGPVTVRSRGKSGWHLGVANRSFRRPVHFWKLQNGAPYHVYIAPAANRIVAMEPIEEPNHQGRSFTLR